MRVPESRPPKVDPTIQLQKFLDEQLKMGGLDHEDFVSIQFGSEKEAHLRRSDIHAVLSELREARAELARIQTLPELEWAQVTASLMMRLSALARAGSAADAQALLDVLDRGKTYVGRMKAEREALREACQAVSDWWRQDGISGTKATDEIALQCRIALATLKEPS